MKKILYLTFYFEPDLCAGSFRNSPLLKELAVQAKGKATIDVITTLPNRYRTFEVDAPQYEERDNITIHRVAVPKHESGMKDQVISFKTYYSQAKKLVKGKNYDLVIASSSRLFTAYLGFSIAKKLKATLYLDIRDIFYDTLEDVLQNGIVKMVALPAIKQIEKRIFNYATHINLISGGFKPYFDSYNHAIYSYYPNGVDDIFINADAFFEKTSDNSPNIRTVVYAGNIGEGQGLHKIIPGAAKAMEHNIRFIIIGDGGARRKLEEELKRLHVTNVELRDPVKRDELIAIYKVADFLFAHLNDFKAFEKVLPSKLFELASFSKPVIAGFGGFAANFVRDNIENSILFNPCDVQDLVQKMEGYNYKKVYRERFVDKFRRDNVNSKMARTMLQYL